MTVSASKRFRLGLVIGKFAPLHRGHEQLIAEAAFQCDRVLILSYTNPEFPRCDVMTRRRWFAERLPQHDAIVFDDAWLRAACQRHDTHYQPIPPNSADDLTHQRFLAWVLTSVLKETPDALFCGEAYGTPSAVLLTQELGNSVTPVLVDRYETGAGISARAIRHAPYLHRQYVAPTVYASFVRRIAVLGGESSGKTTLAAALALEFHVPWVPEYGRELWEQQGGVLTEPDLLHIAQEQIRRENAQTIHSNRFLFCDTSPLTTAGYSGWMFDRVAPELAALAQRPYDGIILCAPDFDFVQDGTRRDSDFRHRQHRWYQDQLAALPYSCLAVRGSVPERVELASAWLSSQF